MISNDRQKLAEEVYKMILTHGIEVPQVDQLSRSGEQLTVYTIKEACESLELQRAQLYRLLDLAGISEEERPLVSAKRRGLTPEQVEILRGTRSGGIKPR